MEQQTIGAAAVAIDGRAVLIEGPSGIGKSSLALALIDRGAALIGDDGVTLVREDETVRACPPPTITGKLEIRHVGIVSLPTVSAPLALIIGLASEAPRLVEAPPIRPVLDADIPAVTLPAHDPQLALRAEWALQMHGFAQ